MKRDRKFLCVAFVLLLDSLALGQLPMFFDTPSPDAMNRTSMRDCPERFYSNVEDELGSFGGYGGVRVLRGEFQHMVAIGWTRSATKIDYLCGGSLISKTFVLTAAHCNADSESIRPDTVRVGDTDLASPEDDEFAQQIAIARMIVHPSFRGSRRYFDIALIVLQKDVVYTNAVCPACLWLEKELPSELMDAIGFGATGFGEDLSPTLQRVVLGSIDLKECSKRITVKRAEMPEGFRSDQFCAASENMDTCEGDSGGPIGVKRLYTTGREIPLVTGVVSFGTPCTMGSTGVYTKISSYIDWIERETKEKFNYTVCSTSTYCPGRPSKSIPVNFKQIYSKSRFGLVWDEDGSSVYECGATLIDYQFFMTTASCVSSSRGHPKYVTFDNEQRIPVTDVYVSPQYVPGRPENDIALVKMAKYVNHMVFRPACLWNRRLDGKWKMQPSFSAYGPVLRNENVENKPILVYTYTSSECENESTRGTNLLCYTNKINFMPRICSMDHGGPVTDDALWGKPVFVYGVVSPLSKDCGSNLFMVDVTPHIDWIEGIVVARRDQYLVFSD